MMLEVGGSLLAAKWKGSYRETRVEYEHVWAREEVTEQRPDPVRGDSGRQRS